MKIETRSKLICTAVLAVSTLIQWGNAFSASLNEIKILAGDGGGSDVFGSSVSISDEYAIVGAFADAGATGSAYVFKREGAEWIEQAKLTASDQTAGDWFGYSVAINGDYALVGAPGNSADLGAAYLFERNGEIWSEVAKLVGSDVATDGCFGWSVSISGDYLIASAPDDDDNGDGSGSVYVFSREGGQWTEEAKLGASNGASFDLFGTSACLSGNYVIVGAPEHDITYSDEGAVYVYEREGLVWTEKAILTERQPKNEGGFGISVAVSGNRAVVGTLASEYAYVLVRDSSGWREEDRIKPSEGINISFGNSVSIYGDFVLAGAILDDLGGQDAGSAYLFRRFASTWIEEVVIVASDGSANDYFGSAVALSSSHVLVGSHLDDDNGTNSGSAYIYDGFLPTEPISARITSNDTPVTIPPEGGTFDYTMHFANNTALPQNTDIWIITERPGPPPVISFGPRDKTFGSAASVSKGRSQAVPANAPAGAYNFILYVGTYPDSIMDSDTLSFTKLASGSSEQAGPSEHGSLLGVQSYPNPFNPSTTLQFSLSQTSQVSLKIFNTLGETVATLISDELSAGTHRVEWNASQNSSGVYFYILQAGGLESVTGKLLLLK